MWEETRMIDRISTNGYSSQLRYTTSPEIKNQTNENETVFVKEHNEQVSHEQMDKDKVEEVVKGLNDFLSPTHTSLKFEFHEKLNEYYVTIVDDQTQSVVKEIPSKKLLDFYAAMTDFIGLMVDKKI